MHPLAFVAVTVYAVVIWGDTIMLSVIPPLDQTNEGTIGLYPPNKLITEELSNG